MRRVWLPALVMALGGCDPDCGSGRQIDGDYAVFANVWEYDGENLDAFPSYMTPANGWSEWSVTWGAAAGGGVVVTIDDQSFSGTGTWDDVECGNFALSLSGTYRSANDSLHEFTADGTFVAYASRFEGVWEWEEDWTSAQGETGTFGATGQVSASGID